MSEFPKLRTGAVMQYPAQRQARFDTFVTRYLDGSEQRFAQRSNPLFVWSIQLNLLSDQEMFRLQEFFMDLEGSAGVFRFIDPWDGTAYDDCFCADPEFTWEWLEEDRSNGMLHIRNGAKQS